MHILATAIGAGSLSFTSPDLLQAQVRTLVGRVVDTSGTVVPFATIEWHNRTTLADDSGRFRITVPKPEAFAIDVRRIGFRPARAEINSGNDTTVTVALVPLPRALSRVTVEAEQTVRSLELRGFYRRLRDREKGANAGQFITAEEIERRNPSRISQMLEGRSGVRVVRLNDLSCLSGNDPRCRAPAGVNGCFMSVYLDGIRLGGLARSNVPTAIDELAIPTHIAGIEIYTTGGRIPPEYQSLAGSCGAILLWTR
jgi:hypothetical protein